MVESEPMAAYLALRERITECVAELAQRYASRLQCRRGCSFCCEAVAFLPIEREALRRLSALAAKNPAPAHQSHDGAPADRSVDRSVHGTFSASGDSGRCAMLDDDGGCTVYEARPIICRTHGLPLAYRVYEYDLSGEEIRPNTPEYTDLWCDLNFRSIEDRHATAYFDTNGRINMDALNAEIESLNAAFLRCADGATYAAHPTPLPLQRSH